MSESNCAGADGEALVRRRRRRRPSRTSNGPACSRSPGRLGGDLVAPRDPHLAGRDVDAGAPRGPRRGERLVAAHDAAGAQLAQRRPVRAHVEPADQRVGHAASARTTAPASSGAAGRRREAANAPRLVARDVHGRRRPVAQRVRVAPQMGRGCAGARGRAGAASGHVRRQSRRSGGRSRRYVRPIRLTSSTIEVSWVLCPTPAASPPCFARTGRV